MTIASARKAGFHAANRRMRSQGRFHWTHADYSLALRTQEDLLKKKPIRIYPPLTPALECYALSAH